jgi:outer membrane protein TolC
VRRWLWAIEAASRYALARLTGKAPEDNSVPELALADFALPGQLPVSLPSQLVRQRPDILEAEDVLHEASAGVGIARAARFPSFNISAQFGRRSAYTSHDASRTG